MKWSKSQKKAFNVVLHTKIYIERSSHRSHLKKQRTQAWFTGLALQNASGHNGQEVATRRGRHPFSGRNHLSFMLEIWPLSSLENYLLHFYSGSLCSWSKQHLMLPLTFLDRDEVGIPFVLNGGSLEVVQLAWALQKRRCPSELQLSRLDVSLFNPNFECAVQCADHLNKAIF